EEMAPHNWLTKTIQVNIANLAGVPSVVYGLLGLTVFVRVFGIFQPHALVERWWGSQVTGLFYSDYYEDYLIKLPFGPVVISAALTLTLLILPVVIISAQEALRAIPPSLRHASLALGATRWQTIRHQVLPAAIPGIMTGIILSVSRAIGETAPLIVIGAPLYTTFAPGGLDSFSDIGKHPEGLIMAPFDGFVAMPMQIYGWITDADTELKTNVAAAGILVLLFFLLILNGLAITIRSRAGRHARW
ncbi:MAG: ABC transporter permease subunit, partial [Planctomycetaceae bacterium]|nr:ABC transporter permease subunit [Planctomycetaceae bacterium]